MPNVRKRLPKTDEEIEKSQKEKQRKIELRKLDAIYKSKRKAASKEENLDFYGEDDVSTKGREDFFQILKEAFRLGKYIPEKDISLIKNAMYTHAEFVDKEKIRFVVEVANKTGGIERLEETVKDFLSLFRDTEYYKSIFELKKWIDSKKLSTKIRQLRKSGLKTEQIAEKIHITSAEVGIFSESVKEMPTLFDDEPR